MEKSGEKWRTSNVLKEICPYEVLIGYYLTKLDEKGRLAVPKRFRGELGEKLVAARWYEGCILLVDRKVWQSLVARLTGGELATLSARDTDRFLLAGSFEIDLDKQGRFVVPESLRGYAQLAQEVVCAALGDRVELWSKSAWEEREKVLLKESGEKIEKLYRERKGNART